MFVPVNRLIDRANSVKDHYSSLLAYNELSRTTNNVYSKRNVKALYGSNARPSGTVDDRGLIPYEFRGLSDEKDRFEGNLNSIFPADVALQVIRILVNREYTDGPKDDARQKLRATFVLLNDEWTTVSSQLRAAVDNERRFTPQAIALMLQSFLAQNFGQTYWTMFGVDSHMDWLDATADGEKELEKEVTKQRAEFEEQMRMDVETPPDMIRSMSFRLTKAEHRERNKTLEPMDVDHDGKTSKERYYKPVSTPMDIDSTFDAAPSFRRRERVSSQVAQEARERFGPAHVLHMDIDEDEVDIPVSGDMSMDVDTGTLQANNHTARRAPARPFGRGVLRETFVTDGGAIKETVGTTIEAAVAGGIKRRLETAEDTMLAPTRQSVNRLAEHKRKNETAGPDRMVRMKPISKRGREEDVPVVYGAKRQKMYGRGVTRKISSSILRGSIKAGNDNPLLSKALRQMAKRHK